MPYKIKISPRKIMRRGHVLWMVETTVNGKRTRQSFASKGEALVEADLITHRRGNLSTLLDHFSPEQIATVSTELARLGAVEHLRRAVDLWLEDDARRSVRVPVDDAVKSWVAARKAAGSRETYISNYGGFLRSLAKSLPDGFVVCDLSKEDVQRWIDSRGQAPWSRATSLKAVRTLTSFCKSQGWLQHDPTEGLSMPIIDDKPPGILTPEDAKRLLNGCRQHDPGLVAIVAVQLFAGLRPSEAQRLVWSEIKPGLIEVTASKSKTRQRRLVEVVPNLAAWLALGGELPAKNYGKRLRAVRAAIKLKWSSDCMRHSFASYLLAKTQNADKVSHELGHASTQMLFAHYRELVTPADAEDYFNLRPE